MNARGDDGTASGGGHVDAPATDGDAWSFSSLMMWCLILFWCLVSCMIEYFEQSVCMIYVATFANYRMIYINLVFFVFFADWKTIAQPRRAPHNSIFSNMLLCGPCLGRLGCATVYQPAKRVWGDLDKRIWGLGFEVSARDALSSNSTKTEIQ
jgi:hypothetical protein